MAEAPERPMAERHEWKESERRYFVDAGGGGRIAAPLPSPEEAPACLPDFVYRLHRQQGIGAAARELLRVVAERDEARARERELLALTGKQHAALVEADSRWNTIDNGYCAVCRCGHRRYVGRWVEKGPCSNPACFSHELTALLSSPDAQKAAGELEELRAELNMAKEVLVRAHENEAPKQKELAKLQADIERLTKRAKYLRRQIDINAENSAKACSSLRARVRELEAGGLALAEDASRMQARLSRLDGLLESEEVPEELTKALSAGLYATSPEVFAADAWRWFREALAVPPAEPREVAWLIELDATTYWDGRALDSFHFVQDAVRFSRQEDAERIIHWLLKNPALKATEHAWLATATPPAEPQEEKL